jgi:uncharacterized protein YbcC (UPF0753/DUF2309 family)/NADH:ubiquinone oxidoreductase subunit 4 (subunit M)
MNLLLVPLLAPGCLILAAFIAALGPGLRPTGVLRLVQILSLLSIAVSIGAAVLLWTSGPGTSALLGLGGVGISVRVDVVSVSLLLLVSLIGWVVLRYAANYLDGEHRQGQFIAWMAATLGAVLLLVQSGNLGGFFLAWLMTGHGLQQLLLFYRDRVPAQRAARKKFVFTRLGELALAAAFVLLWITFETADIVTMLNQASAGAASSPIIVWAAALLALAAVLQSVQFPAHGWLIEVVETPTPVSALLHAGVVNAGGFLLIRFADVLLMAPGVMAVLVLIGGLSALVGALSMLAQPAIKNSLAWSTVAQMGFMIMQCGLGLFAIALLHILAHSLYKAHAFLLSGMAVDTVAANRRPGPVAVPDVRAVLRAFALALAVYTFVAVAFSLLGSDKSLQALVLGAVLVFGVAYLVAQGLAEAAPREITRRTVLYSVAVSLSYFALQTFAEALTAAALPPTPAPGALEWALLILVVASFALVAFAQALFPNWAQHPAAAGLRIHLANGLYVNAFIDRALGNWTLRSSSPQANVSTSDDQLATSREVTKSAKPEECRSAAEAAVRQIPPLWPLDATVAVNPFLGQANETLAETQARLARIGGVPVTMPRCWYRERLAKGLMDKSDLAAALAEASEDASGLKPDDLVEATTQQRPTHKPLPTIADLAAQVSGTDWPAIVEERFAAWASAWFDHGQALWAAPRTRGAWAEYQAFATQDLTPEIAGLKQFAQFVADAPDEPLRAIARSTLRLGLSPEALLTYYHQLLHGLGGWSQSARYLLFQAELADGHDDTTLSLLAIRLLWEEALFLRYQDSVEADWRTIAAAHAQPPLVDTGARVDALLQLAAERGAQRALVQTLTGPGQQKEKAQPKRWALQAAFCIDVRSERFRRALESLDPSIQTLGFAGFFGVSAQHKRFASDVPERRLPVLLNPTLESVSGSTEEQAEDHRVRLASRVLRAWGRFKFAAVSSFAFVESMGPVYLVKLVRDALGTSAAQHGPEPTPRLVPQPDPTTATGMAETVLRAMSLTRDFAPVVLLLGHGATVVNNPQASALHCGACGGYQGDANARLLASLLNNHQVRQGLAARGIQVPSDTVFIAGLHDTVTDAVSLYDHDPGAALGKQQLADVHAWLDSAGTLCRQERALSLPGSDNRDSVASRARSWSEVRPEWALAGCQAFIAAPRGRTAGKDLGGSTFLHDYAWRDDEAQDFTVLELILTAPVVVASWINLQYYGSTVAPEHFGSGNKLLHNVVGGMGVFEGNAGILRGGLAWQSVHDGERYVHDPLRLTVFLEAPRSAIDEILARHDEVRTLFDRGWIHLIVLDNDGLPSHRFSGLGNWSSLKDAAGSHPAD